MINLQAPEPNRRQRERAARPSRVPGVGFIIGPLGGAFAAASRVASCYPAHCARRPVDANL